MNQSIFVPSFAFALAMTGVATSTTLARADFFGRTAGSFVFVDDTPPVLTGTLDQFFIAFKGPFEFQSLTMSFEITRHDDGADDLTGTFSFIGADPADVLRGVYSGINFANKDNIWTSAGAWSTVAGEGAFANASGSGAFTMALFLEDGSAATAFDGVIVPAPAATAALLSFIPFAARRRRHPR